MTTNNAVNVGLAGSTGTGNFVGSTSPTITTPKIAQINDPTQNLPTATFIGTVSAVNYFQFSSSATGTAIGLQAVGTDSNIALGISGKGTSGINLTGFTDASNAASGVVGEYMSSTITQASATSFTSASTVNLTSITLSAGDWDVWGNAGLNGTTVTLMDAGISTSTGALPNLELMTYMNFTAATGAIISPVPQQRISVSSSTPVYLVINGTGTGTMHMFGFIAARRVR